MQGSHQHTRPAVGKEGQLGPLGRHSPRGAGTGPRAPFWEWFPRVGAVGWMLTACKGLRARGSSAFGLLKDTLLGGFPLGVWLEGHVCSFPSPLQKSKAHRGSPGSGSFGGVAVVFGLKSWCTGALLSLHWAHHVAGGHDAVFLTRA